MGNLVQDDASAHTAMETYQKIQEQGRETIPRSPYCPDIAPYDCYLLHLLKVFLVEKTVSKFDDISREVAYFFDSQPPQFWEKGIADLPVRWSTVVANSGDYIVD